jgi:hypothetical protein
VIFVATNCAGCIVEDDWSCHRRRMTSELTNIILRVVERAPQWIRHDLDSKDGVARIRAEEALAAMIADAVGQQDDAD